MSSNQEEGNPVQGYQVSKASHRGIPRKKRGTAAQIAQIYGHTNCRKTHPRTAVCLLEAPETTTPATARTSLKIEVGLSA